MARLTVKQQLARWPRGYARDLAMQAVKTADEGDAKVLMTHNRGKLVGVMGYKLEDKWFVVNQLASNRKGEGTRMMTWAAREAVDSGRTIRLAPSPAAQGFYDRLGFERLDRKDAPEEELQLRGKRLELLAVGR